MILSQVAEILSRVHIILAVLGVHCVKDFLTCDLSEFFAPEQLVYYFSIVKNEGKLGAGIFQQQP